MARRMQQGEGREGTLERRLAARGADSVWTGTQIWDTS